MSRRIRYSAARLLPVGNRSTARCPRRRRRLARSTTSGQDEAPSPARATTSPDNRTVMPVAAASLGKRAADRRECSAISTPASRVEIGVGSCDPSRGRPKGVFDFRFRCLRPRVSGFVGSDGFPPPVSTRAGIHCLIPRIPNPDTRARRSAGRRRPFQRLFQHPCDMPRFPSRSVGDLVPAARPAGNDQGVRVCRPNRRQ